MIMKNIYFISDAHLGSWAISHGRMQERRLVRFLDDVKDKAEAVFMLGDMFDFWYEFRYAVPKGFTRFLGKVSELTDNGVEVHFFIGNHDIWCGDYLEKECGVIIHRQHYTTEIHGQEFFLAHGDGLGDDGVSFKLLRKIFHSRFLQICFSAIHPRWSLKMGHEWAKNSMVRHLEKGIPVFCGEEGEPLVRYSKEYLTTHPSINYFIFGHRHLELNLQLSHPCRMLILGDWIQHFSYAVFNGKNLEYGNYVEGETKL